MIILKKKLAFTLVEIMIVVAIIAILAVIAVPNFLRARISSNEASARSTLKVIGSALDTFSADNMAYPANTGELISTLPSYLQKDYFSGVHSGYTYAASTLSDYDYSIVATPQSESTGQKVFTLSTGSVLTEVDFP